MKIAALALIAVGAFTVAAAPTGEADSEGGNKLPETCEYGEYHRGSRPIGIPGCAWYWCNGQKFELWIDCGPGNTCIEQDGAPACKNLL